MSSASKVTVRWRVGTMASINTRLWFGDASTKHRAPCARDGVFVALNFRYLLALSNSWPKAISIGTPPYYRPPQEIAASHLAVRLTPLTSRHARLQIIAFLLTRRPG